MRDRRSFPSLDQRSGTPRDGLAAQAGAPA